MKKIVSLLSISAAALTGLFQGVLVKAQALTPSLDIPESFGGLGSQDLKITIANIVQIVLGFLGILTVLIILLGGFKWMTSGGNEDKIDEAKKLISAGVVGLVIVLAAYAIATFIVGNIGNAVTGTTS
ncbi:MAG: hypothetical protein V1846_02920 [Candidatus Komeilibacteria bacterium]